jgi:hypothetical protein
MLHWLAFVTFQLNVEVAPDVMLVGFAVNERTADVMCTGSPTAKLPAEPLHVSVYALLIIVPPAPVNVAVVLTLPAKAEVPFHV